MLSPGLLLNSAFLSLHIFVAGLWCTVVFSIGFGRRWMRVLEFVNVIAGVLSTSGGWTLQ